ncbi:hydrolase [Bdellovibrio bacteriovorus]|uniref:Putative hydrolase n=1 Tax=Bdellovibrio bacteriovorus str. Tiberius TaxID=1069642 RepID=K7ZET5_BDEBC|nr:hydrolase [Bdellovibrio bacteriovorus]AFY00812.1 putative hydrolase [Bdellovibrio bacteriovorus str. Tiberius]
MKTMILTILLASIPTLTLAQQWPTNPVIGMIGASFSECAAPENSPLAGMGFAGCSYETLSTALTKNSRITSKKMRVQTLAQGGARSYDIPGTGYRGYVSQINALLTRTQWIDGTNRTKVVVASLMNDCLHTVPCTTSDIDNVLIEGVRQTAQIASSKGIKLIVTGYPDWQDLNLALIGGIFQLPNLISEQDYNYLKTRFEQQVSQIPGVIYLDVWKHNFKTIDGLHPDEASVEKAADLIAKTITSL